MMYPIPIPSDTPSGVSVGHLKAVSIKAATVHDCNEEGGEIACVGVNLYMALLDE